MKTRNLLDTFVNVVLGHAGLLAPRRKLPRSPREMSRTTSDRVDRNATTLIRNEARG